MVVLNYRGEKLRDKLREYEVPGGRIWLVNSDGYWLMGPTPEDEGGFQLPERSGRRLATVSPPLWQQMQRQKSGIYQAARSWLRFERIYPLLGTDAGPSAGFAQPVAARDYSWVLAVELSQAALQAADVALLKKLSWVYSVLVAFVFLGVGLIIFVIHRKRALTHVMEQVVDNLPQMVAYVDTEQRYRFNNMTYQRLVGLSPKEKYGKTLLEVLGEADYQTILPCVERVLAGETVNFENTFDYGRSEVHDMVVAYLPDFSPQGGVRGFYVIVNDISAFKASDRRERQRILEMARIARVSSMGGMAAEIAHEINQPLAAMAMYSEAGQRILESGRDHGQVKTWLGAINTQAKRASEIVRRVRRFVQPDESEFVQVDLNAAIHAAAAMVEHEAQSHGITVTLDLTPTLPPVQGSAVLLEQAVFNLVRRAIDALVDYPQARVITLTTTVDAQRVHVAVHDTGPILDPALGEQIFDSFLTRIELSENAGLVVSRTIVEAHAGTLRYVSDGEEGTRFMFSLARDDIE
jgi:PAS domain S-box-containing protein